MIALRVIYGLISAFFCMAFLYETIMVLKNPERLNDYVGDKAFLFNILYLSFMALWFLLGMALSFLKKRNNLLNAILIIHISIMIFGTVLFYTRGY
jgi:hypothetical protein